MVKDWVPTVIQQVSVVDFDLEYRCDYMKMTWDGGASVGHGMKELDRMTFCHSLAWEEGCTDDGLA